MDQISYIETYYNTYMSKAVILRFAIPIKSSARERVVVDSVMICDSTICLLTTCIVIWSVLVSQNHLGGLYWHFRGRKGGARGAVPSTFDFFPSLSKINLACFNRSLMTFFGCWAIFFYLCPSGIIENPHCFPLAPSLGISTPAQFSKS